MWASRLEDSNLDDKLASNLDQQGKLELQINQTWFRELACWEQLEVRWAGSLKIARDLVKTNVF